MSILHVITFAFSFVGMWVGAGLIVSSAVRFAKKLRLSPFSFSFFVLGMLTSIPEFSVGMTAVAESKPSIFVGNLIGSIPVIFFLVIPVLAIFGKSINLGHTLTNKQLILAFIIILLPTVTAIDGRLTGIEGVVLIIAYIILFFVIERKKGVLDAEGSEVLTLKSYSLLDILKILFGIALLFVSSHFIVENTLYFSSLLHISPFYISLLLLSFGTNLPELSLAVRSVISGNKEVAFGDYIGSAAANTFLFGLFILMSQGDVLSGDNFITTLVLLAFGLSLIYYFSRTKHAISRTDGFFLLALYVIFLLVEHTF